MTSPTASRICWDVTVTSNLSPFAVIHVPTSAAAPAPEITTVYLNPLLSSFAVNALAFTVTTSPLTVILPSSGLTVAFMGSGSSAKAARGMEAIIAMTSSQEIRLTRLFFIFFFLLLYSHTFKKYVYKDALIKLARADSRRFWLSRRRFIRGSPSPVLMPKGCRRCFRCYCCFRKRNPS